MARANDKSIRDIWRQMNRIGKLADHLNKAQGKDYSRYNRAREITEQYETNIGNSKVGRNAFKKGYNSALVDPLETNPQLREAERIRQGYSATYDAKASRSVRQGQQARAAGGAG